MEIIKILMDEERVKRAILRMTWELRELTSEFKDTILIGIRPRGFPIAERIMFEADNLFGIHVPIGILETYLYRDDLTSIAPTRTMLPTKFPEPIHEKIIVLVDSMIKTGRTTRAALDALIDFGRPSKIILAVLVDTGQREILCIQPNVVGKKVRKPKENEKIKVELENHDKEDRVLLVKRA